MAISGGAAAQEQHAFARRVGGTRGRGVAISLRGLPAGTGHAPND